MELSKVEFKEFTIFYKNQFELDFLLKEIFKTDEYYFESSKDKPIIVDCGAHIGISVLYFKFIYPNAKIVAFEPDPVNFEILKINVSENELEGIELHNVALTGSESEIIMFGDFSEDSESVGNTIVPQWGERPTFSNRKVNTVKLSTYLNEPVDYLKIDVEGAEREVIVDISSKLNLVRNIYVEVHEFKGSSNFLSNIQDILLEKDFDISTQTIEIGNILYEKFPQWVTKHNPRIYSIKGKK